MSTKISSQCINLDVKDSGNVNRPCFRAHGLARPLCKIDQSHRFLKFNFKYGIFTKKWLLGLLLTVILPAVSHKGGLLVGLKAKIDNAIVKVEHVTEVVEEIAEEADKIVEEVEAKLPGDSKLKKTLDKFDQLAKQAVEEAKLAEDIIHKDLKEKEKLMMEWAETNTLATAVRRKMYVLTNYREMLLRTFLESYRRYLELDQPWTDMAVQVINLLSAAHSQSLEDLKAQQQEHKIEMVQPNSSLPVIDSTDRSGFRLAHFYSIAKSICWVRPMVLIDEVWTPLQGSGYWRSNCTLSLFIDRKRLSESVVTENFDSQVSLIEPARYWGAKSSQDSKNTFG
ncbi:hypothetical protein F511_35993 [Dorcoceras hygrometricum]|uniref:Uncharacterized protein n=1 Tax=Dorcoceras hygrometricum TaxID=472368 RepID=A0A2Z7C148_9LAMI|nr:hypothetical protein F511_35993 [Dorcoceras hygrometricum]